MESFLISPIGFDFGDVPMNAGSPQQAVTVTNVNVVPLVVNMAGGAAGLFGGSQNCQGKTLAPGASCQIFYRFTPNALGPVVGSAAGTVNGLPFAFDFQGNGIRRFLISPIGFDFGEVAVGAMSQSQTVNVTNASSAAVTVNMAGGAAGVFGGSQNCQGQTLAPGASCQIFYRFAPVTGGPATGASSGSVNGQPFVFDFEGVAVPEPTGPTVSMVGLAAIGVLAYRRRGRRFVTRELTPAHSGWQQLDERAVAVRVARGASILHRQSRDASPFRALCIEIACWTRARNGSKPTDWAASPRARSAASAPAATTRCC